MLGRLVLVSFLALCNSCCAALCSATYSSALDDCDERYPRHLELGRNERCRATAQESLDLCESRCTETETTPEPTY